VTAREVLHRLLDRFRRGSLSRDLADELRFHQNMLERDHLVGGATPDDARRRGVIELGNPTYNIERARDMWSLGWVDDLMNDIRFAARVLRRNPAFSIAVVITLALGIGANTAIFSVVNAVILRPLPYADPDRLFSIWTVPASTPTDRNPTSYPDIRDWEAQNSVFTGIGAYAFNRFEVTGPDGTALVRAVIGSPHLYEVLGARPLLGRMPRADEDRVAVVAVSHRYWQDRFGGRPDILGAKINLGDSPYTIVGVMPPGFQFPSPDIDLWVSMYNMTVVGGGATGPWISNRGLRGYRSIARLKPGITAVTAERQMNDIQRRLGEAYPAQDAGISIKLRSIGEETTRGVAGGLWLILGATGFVLLLACVNVAPRISQRPPATPRVVSSPMDRSFIDIPASWAGYASPSRR
jgi:hypothetical protein